MQKSSEQWETYLHDIGIKESDLSRHVYLISHASICSPCKSELTWWNKAGTKIDSLRITLILLETYKSSFNSFLKVNNFTLPAFRDSAGIIFKHELIPYPPVKIYFNKDSKIAAIEHIGTNGHLTEFIKLIKADK